ncbi:hypothetical protein XENTR_v10011425 [Xenopus tropicalis]|nr:hypothetical protein XENTR_v10011425 [Xenopus tropicalis]
MVLILAYPVAMHFNLALSYMVNSSTSLPANLAGPMFYTSCVCAITYKTQSLVFTQTRKKIYGQQPVFQ